MSFNSESKRVSGSKPFRLLEMELDNQTNYFGSPSLKDTTHYKSRVKNITGLGRSVDLVRYDIRTSEAQIELDDADNAISQIVQDEVIDGKTGTVKLAFKDDSGTITKETMISGELARRTTTTGRPVSTVAILPKLRGRIGVLQRAITKTAFPNAPEKNVGKGQNIVFGDVDTTTASNGAVWLPITDTTNRKCSVAQHACKEVTNVIKIKGDVVTNLVLTTDYTVNSNDTDGDSKTYTSITLTVGAYDLEAQYYADVAGIESNGDGTGTLERNPANALKTILTDTDYTNTLLSASDVDSAAFTAWANVCAARDYNVAGESGGVIPWNKGEIITDARIIISEWMRSFDGVCFVKGDGTISVNTADVSEQDSDDHEEIRIQDLTPQNLSVNTSPFTILNKTRALYKWAHAANNFEDSTTATDEGSVSAYGTIEDETRLYFVRGDDTAEDVIKRYLLRRGGRTVEVTLPINGLQLIDEVDVTDTIEVTHNHIAGGWTNKQFYVTSVDPQLMQCRETIRAVSRADIYGPVSFSGEETDTFNPSVDTYVNSLSSSTSYGSSTTLKHWHNPSHISSYSRAAYRFDLSDIDSAGGTIVSATLKLYLTHKDNASNFTLRQLLSTAWSGASTFNNFDGSAWSESNIGGTSLANDIAVAGVGFNSFVLNSAGVTYLNQRLISDPLGGGPYSPVADNLAQFTHQALNIIEEYTIASVDHATTSWRPTLTVTYTT